MPSLTPPAELLQALSRVLAGRPKDLDDIRGVLLAQAGRLDVDRTRRVLAMLEEALGVSDLLPVFEKLAEG